MEASTGHSNQKVFPPTRWSVVRAAQDRSEEALETICKLYWLPLYAYARRCGYSVHDAQDLTQDFFRVFLEKGWVDIADPERGRLRTFLLTAFKRFAVGEWRRASALKRGGACRLCPIDTQLAESLSCGDSSQLAPEEVFDRQWAVTLLNMAVTSLQKEYAEAGKGALFEALKECLTASHTSLDYKALAHSAGISAEAARVAVHRLRKRFRAIYREEVRLTLPPGADVDDEMRHLALSLARE